MNKLLISASVLAALGLSGCGGGDSLSDIKEDAPAQTPFSRVVFDPAAGNLNIPNDLLMLPGDDGFFDYTLNIPVADPSDFSDPQNALNVLDGWSTTQPFVIDVVTPPNTSLDESTLSQGIHLYEATLGLNQNDPDCAAIPIPSAGCKVGDKLVFGQDYIVRPVDNNTVTVIPLRPLKPAQGYLLVMTDDLKDSSGKGVQGSTTWDLVKQDINTRPLATESQLSLQTLINLHLDSLRAASVNTDNVTYVSAFTTQSVSNVLDTVKQLMVSEFAQRAAAGDPTAGQALPAIVARDVATQPNTMEFLGLVSQALVDGAVQVGISQLPPEAAPIIPAINASDFSSFTTCSGLLNGAGGGFGSPVPQVNDFAAQVATGVLTQVGPFCAADRFEGNISLPYYSGVPSATNPLAPVNTFWTAACDSGIVLANAASVLPTAEPGPNAALCAAVGLADVRVNGELLDRDRNLTKFSPVPQATGGNEGNETLDVQITVPNPMVAGALGITLEKPEAGWPVVMLAHGITSQKEDMLAITGALSLAGFATFAIDQPIHGSRGFDLNGDGVDDLNATTVSATHYLNLGSLPTGRDNLRQSVSDLLGLRLGLNAVVDATATQSVDIDTSNVSVFGVSLGAITGGNFASVANTGFEGPLAAFDGLFAVQAASLESPGGGTANFLLESAAFGPLVKGLLLSQGSPEFQAFLIDRYGSVAVSEADLTEGVGIFLGAISPEQLATANALFAQFAFAAQTVIDSSDPINYFETLAANTPVHMMTVIGDGGETNLPDQVIPVTTALPLAGQQALVDIMGLPQVSTTTAGTSPQSGVVFFNQGAHASSLSPASSPAVTTEMQRQVASYVASGATAIVVTNEDVVAN
ncbi:MULTISPECIES: VolA/Pla-1 family phospholipase [Alteromonadaceae]|uniref:Bacterial virulence factor lipase N-terminal domain-containing protein n=1 Tax=Brumicola blandensis TaxID=3075611 RepID=A0AAW8QX66_9ALTE|nr:MULTISPECIES: VolA/Pla-1 family phospholipase [unclassified Alteromonas]MDT0581681.1 hypothetical protein [Alteromonas sp. W409]MDT0627256.1 hypothetical protein [Alteromonas sp. W364]